LILWSRLRDLNSLPADAAPSIQDEMAAALAAQLGQTTMQLNPEESQHQPNSGDQARLPVQRRCDAGYGV